MFNRHGIYLTFLSSLTICLLSSTALARNPKGCKNIGVSTLNDHLVLIPKLEANVFLIQNKSGRTIEIQRVIHNNNPLIIKLEAKLRPYAWTSLAIDHPSIEFTCHTVSSHIGSRQVSCQNALNVCQYAGTKFAKHNQGTYWVLQNQSKHNIVHKTIKKGILLR